MKVVVSVGGKFSAFHQAEVLQERECLAGLMTSYYDPNRNGKGYDIDPALVRTHLPSALMTYGPRFIPILRGGLWTYLAHEVFDRWAARNLFSGDIVLAWSGWALHTIRAAKKQGAITLVHRGSAHIVRHRELLSEEYEKLGTNEQLPSQFIMNKERQEYMEADYVSVPSLFAKRSFVRQGIPAEKIVRVTYGVSLEHFKPIPKKDEVFRVMHIGGTVQKGTHHLIRAMAELELVTSELLLIGSQRQYTRELLDNLQVKYRVLDHVPHLELHNTYSQSSVYVLPSIQDGFARVVSEAMACGVPVICSANTGAADIVRDGVDGFVVPAGDVEALKEKILYLYEHKEERRAMGRSALERAHEFTWDRYGEEIVETYRSLLAKSEGDVS